MLKPAGADAGWIAETITDIVEDGFRVPRPLRAGPRWVVDDWAAWARIDGRHRSRDTPWTEALDVAHRFEAALSSVARPPYLDARTDRWAVADRAAWGEIDVEVPEDLVPVLARLRAGRPAVDGRLQVVHGDLAGNLLWADAGPPAVIDLSAYWRPAGYTAAVVAVDAVLWFGADASLLDTVPTTLASRALEFRLRTAALLGDRARLRADIRTASPLSL